MNIKNLENKIGIIHGSGARPVAMWVATDAAATKHYDWWLGKRTGWRDNMKRLAALHGFTSYITDADDRLIGFRPNGDVPWHMRQEAGRVVPRRNTHEGAALAANIDRINDRVRLLPAPGVSGSVTVDGDEEYRPAVVIGEGSRHPVVVIGANPDHHASDLRIDPELWQRVDDARLDDLLDRIWR